jgi:hypothetical protein
MTCKTYDRLTLLSYVAGDLSVKLEQEVGAHLTTCGACAKFVEETRREQADFLEAFPVAPAAPEPARRMLPFPVPRQLFALAAALVCAIGLGTVLLKPTHDDYRTKGAVELTLFVRDSTGTSVAQAAPVCVPGDRIQFTYSCGTDRCLILMSIDDTGKVSVFYPAKGDRSMIVEPGNGLPLPNSIILDDYIGRERYIAVFSEKPLEVDAVVNNVRAASKSREGIESLKIRNATVKIINLTKRSRRP